MPTPDGAAQATVVVVVDDEAAVAAVPCSRLDLGRRGLDGVEVCTGRAIVEVPRPPHGSGPS